MTMSKYMNPRQIELLEKNLEIEHIKQSANKNQDQNPTTSMLQKVEIFSFPTTVCITATSRRRSWRSSSISPRKAGKKIIINLLVRPMVTDQ